MLFVGAIPRESVEQAFRVVRMQDVGKAFVCCSGSFRFEQALARRLPLSEIHSNDVSLLSTALAQCALGAPLGFRFTGQLEFLEELTAGGDGLERLGAIAVAVQMAQFSASNVHARAHYEHYRTHARSYMDDAKARLGAYLDKLKLTSYFCGDFREHAKRAIETGGHIFAWPPTYSGGYERLYKLLDKNTEWVRPQYGMFHPRELPAWLTELDGAGAKYCVCADHPIDGREAQAYFKAGRSRAVYLYTNAQKCASVRTRPMASKAFKYRAVDVKQLTAETAVRVVTIDSQRMNFLKDRYLAPGLEHVAGVLSQVVLLDGGLAGGFIYVQSDGRFADERMKPTNTVYLLSDFAVSRERKLSKLIAMLATGQESVRRFDLRRVQRTKYLVTTAFTDKAVSMKYRGIFELMSRKPGKLNYLSEVRHVSDAAIYADWWRRFAARDADRQATA